MKKKILSMMLVAAMTVGTLAGCGSNSGNGNSEKGTDTTADAGEEVTIQFMHMQVEQERQDVIAKLIEEFEAENPGIKVEQMPTNEDDYDTKITSLGGTGVLPAVMEFSQDQAKTSVTNDFIDLEANKEVIDGKGEDAFFDGALNVIKTEDGNDYVGVPVSGWVQGIWCNTAMLKEKGFDVPQNWDDVLEIAKAFYNPDNKQYGIALPTSESAFSEQVFSQFAISNGANVFDADGNVTIDTPEMKEALDFYKELSSYSMPGSTEVADVKDAFINQNAPLCLYSTYILSAVQEAGFLDDVELALPNKTQQAAYGCVIVLSIASGLSDAEKAAAEKFVSFMLEKENNESWLLMAPGGIQPVLSEVAEDAAYKENEAIVPLAHLLDEVGVAFDNLQLFGCVDGKNYMVMGDVTNKGILSKMINNVVVQGSDSQTELTNAQAEVETMLK
ncbi:extracellular solute-binding protein [Roseburia sp. AF22-2LB]|jgi:multiple sugar transport system substrate-binding protein|uniref:ABC transporter substrate-binding protein n=1 Tax=unclassified Roseburia TaxID=2637578 RepID=UPI000E4BD71E|nr:MULTISPECIES: extracellular solute-binding protein [unclassified Roseburia]RGG42045.1 extracellular solute-binding protein [Roseburia sp. AF22-8AC]RGG44516.1 extracellular solute-binding protein [Roseburia sp. AF22-2LB]RHS28980.1 extracellular solute-binding protein [Roseburia sp. AF12-17LB]